MPNPPPLSSALSLGTDPASIDKVHPHCSFKCFSKSTQQSHDCVHVCSLRTKQQGVCVVHLESVWCHGRNCLAYFYLQGVPTCTSLVFSTVCVSRIKKWWQCWGVVWYRIRQSLATFDSKFFFLGGEGGLGKEGTGTTSFFWTLTKKKKKKKNGNYMGTNFSQQFCFDCCNLAQAGALYLVLEKWNPQMWNNIFCNSSFWMQLSKKRADTTTLFCQGSFSIWVNTKAEKLEPTTRRKGRLFCWQGGYLFAECCYSLLVLQIRQARNEKQYR